MSRYTFPRYRLLQFAKAPHPGKVKTRLLPRLSEEACVALHCGLTREVFSRVRRAQLCPQELWVGDCPGHALFSELVAGTDVPVRQQSSGDLGRRMAFAVEKTLVQPGVEGVILIGSDCPFIDASYLSDALRRMTAGATAVMGPATDGGYVLLGVKCYDQSLFDGIAWGTARVGAQTREALTRLAWYWELLPALSDIDRPEDLDLLPEHLKPAPRSEP